MRVKTYKAANDLGIHTSTLFQYINGLASDLKFEEIWPDIDQNLIDTIAALIRHNEPHKPDHDRTIREIESTKYMINLSDNAIHVLDKLMRQGKWGSVSVTLDALLNLTHISKRDLHETIAELRKGEYLHQDRAGRGTISLNPAKRNEIETVVLKIR